MSSVGNAAWLEFLSLEELNDSEPDELLINDGTGNEGSRNDAGHSEQGTPTHKPSIQLGSRPKSGPAVSRVGNVGWQDPLGLDDFNESEPDELLRNDGIGNEQSENDAGHSEQGTPTRKPSIQLGSRPKSGPAVPRVGNVGLQDPLRLDDFNESEPDELFRNDGTGNEGSGTSESDVEDDTPGTKVAERTDFRTENRGPGGEVGEPFPIIRWMSRTP
jgi:hypothetical protein